MAKRLGPSNALLANRAPETSLSVQLHPLVLLTISDYITRHTLRQIQGPIVGAVIGQQNGRQYTLEHAYECLTSTSKDKHDAAFDEAFFTTRLEQYKDVHKASPLDLVAIFMLGSSDGPNKSHLQALKQAQTLAASDGILLLLFHPDMVDKLDGGKLPITLYESFEEQTDDNQHTKFWERNFEVETGEAEMIGVDFVAKGGGNAGAVTRQGQSIDTVESSSKDPKGKGKSKVTDEEVSESESNVDKNTTREFLSAEDEELVASLTAKINAVKMLKTRITLIEKYLTSLPASTLTDAKAKLAPSSETNFALLRNVQAMLSRLPLLAPRQFVPSSRDASLSGSTAVKPSQAQFGVSNVSEQEDVQLTSLLASLTKSVAQAQSLGSRFSDVQRERSIRDRPHAGGRGMPITTDMMDTNGP